MEVTTPWDDEELLAFVGEGVLIARDRTSEVQPVSPWLASHADRIRLADGDWPPSLTTYHPADRLQAVVAFRESLERPNEVLDSFARWRDGDHWRLVRVRRVNLLVDPRVGAMIAISTDAGRTVVEERGESTLTTLQYESPPWMLLYLDNLGTVVGSEGMVDEMVGRSAAELVGTSALDLIDPAMVSDILAVWVELLERPGEVRTMQIRLSRPDGSVNWVEISFINRLGAEHEGSVLVIYHDISEKRAGQEQRQAALHLRAECDSLTGLLNRSALDECLLAAVEQEEDLVILFLDLDGFKVINDTSGHDAGDAVLKAVAERLRGVVRPSDQVGRYGGDEFVAICPGVAPTAEGPLVERIVSVLETPVEWDGGSCVPHASIGVARHRPGEDVASLLRRADTSMFERKRAHHGRLVDRSSGL
jgi:diguanylate cyclase (GGDEF)-like protein/PAS domain S-box-containing protein